MPRYLEYPESMYGNTSHIWVIGGNPVLTQRSERFHQLVERSDLTRGIIKTGKLDLPNSAAQK